MQLLNQTINYTMASTISCMHTKSWIYPFINITVCNELLVILFYILFLTRTHSAMKMSKKFVRYTHKFKHIKIKLSADSKYLAEKLVQDIDDFVCVCARARPPHIIHVVFSLIKYQISFGRRVLTDLNVCGNTHGADVVFLLNTSHKNCKRRRDATDRNLSGTNRESVPMHTLIQLTVL